MPTPVIMPKFEMAQETGTVSKWLKQEGDPVEKGEPILEIETDKINMEVESPATGILRGISAGPGAVVPIGQTIAYILKPGELLPADAAAPAAAQGKRPAAKPGDGGLETEPVPAPSPAQLPERITPVAERMAQTHGLDVQAIPRHGERVTKADIESFLADQQLSGSLKTPEISINRIKAVPAARRLARELDLDLAAASGSGPDGRIQSADVQQAAIRQSVAVPASEAGQPATGRIAPLTPMRRTIAERLAVAVRDIPQFTLSLEVEMSRAQQIIDDTRTTPAGPRVTLTALLVKACAWTLARHPQVNASFNQDSILEWAEINIGVAVAVEAGLVVPVIHQSDRKSLGEIAAQLNGLGARAREGKLRAEELRGGTFTISNLGMFGVEHFTAIINPPQAAILAVGRTVKRPIVTEDDQIVVKPMANFTLTADHRVVDGVQAARFLADLRYVLEHPGVLL